MADAWADVFTELLTMFDRPNFHSIDGPALSLDDQSSLDAVFTEEEIVSAISRCQASKSGGPDGLPNAWYRDYANEVGPILAKLFRRCFEAGIFPKCFQSATVVCIPKAGKSTDPLAYRPISLLNSDYKIFTKVLSARLKPMLNRLVAAVQGGFVPGRNIHHVIDIFSAAQALAKQHKTQMVGVLLDIKKAYDSINRNYLLDCLRSSGFPPRFVKAVAATHANTKARFRVNGFLSEPISMTRGIRQGCPLAPLLFILAIDPLYRRLLQDGTLGDPLPVRPGVVPPVAGFADDTAVYLESEAKLPALVTILDEFAAASGLTVHPQKCFVIRLNAAGGDLVRTGDFHFLSVRAMCRYLGIQVGSQVNDEEVWSLTMQQLDTRLRMAQLKTHSVQQRATIAHAVVVPKLLYIARHHWPSQDRWTAVEQSLWRFVWGDTFQPPTAAAPPRNRRWMTQAVAKLSTHHGGLGAPCVRTSLLALAASVVEEWAYTVKDDRDALVSAAGWLDSHFIDPPTRLTARQKPVRILSTLWATGREVLRELRAVRIPEGTQLWIQDALQALSATSLSWRWHRAAYVRDYSDFYRIGGKLLEARRVQDHGECNVDWLPNMSITHDGSGLLRADGTLFCAHALRSLGTGTRLSDFVSWHWDGPMQLRFSPIAVAFPLTNAQSALFRELCDSIVGNFPAVLRRPSTSPALRPSKFTADADVQALWVSPVSIAITSAGIPQHTVPARCQQDLVGLPLVRIDDALIRPIFLCGPTLTKLVQVWTGRKPWRPSARRLRRALKAELVASGVRARDERRRRWTDDDPDITAALFGVDWRNVLKAPGLSPQDTEFWHKTRLHQIYSWRTADDGASCPRDDCLDPDFGATGHILWRCARHNAVWRQILLRWGRPPASDATIKTEIFGWETPPSDLDWRAQILSHATLSPEHLAQLPTRLEHWLGRAWVHLVTATARCLWSDHIALLLNDESPPCPDRISAIMARWKRRLGTLQAGVPKGETAQLDRLILRTISRQSEAAPASIPRLRLSADRYLLFFDGGSRGNPGPGGSGSVIVRVRDHFAVVWVAAMSFANPKTTNNYAEFQGLIVGLQAAVQFQWHPLTVIGDSNMILTLMRRRKPPKAQSLRPLFAQARQAAASLRVTGWHHHYRAQNKMADKAANVAMDARRSWQAFAQDERPELTQIQVLLSNDVAPWVERLLNSPLAPDRPEG